jgi:hypothetical protein
MEKLTALFKNNIDNVVKWDRGKRHTHTQGIVTWTINMGVTDMRDYLNGTSLYPRHTEIHVVIGSKTKHIWSETVLPRGADPALEYLQMVMGNHSWEYRRARQGHEAGVYCAKCDARLTTSHESAWHEKAKAPALLVVGGDADCGRTSAPDPEAVSDVDTDPMVDSPAPKPNLDDKRRETARKAWATRRARAEQTRRKPSSGEATASCWLTHEEISVLDREADRRITTRSRLLTEIVRSYLNNNQLTERNNICNL